MNRKRKKEVRESGLVLAGVFLGSQLLSDVPPLEAALYCLGFYLFILVGQYFFSLNDIDIEIPRDEQ